MTTPIGDLEAWIRGRPKRTARLVLRSVIRSGEGEKSATVAEYELDLDALEIATDVDRVARTDAAAIGNGLPCRYALAALDASGEQLSRKVFRRSGDILSTEEAAPEEPPNATGLVGQAMRHTEAMMRMSILASGDAQRAILQDNERLRARVAELETRQMSTLELFEKLQTQAQEREIAAAAAATRAKYQARIIDEVVAPLAPRLVTKFLDSVLPEDARYQRVRRLLGSLRDEQLAKVFEVLDTDQAQQVAEMLAEGSSAGKSSPAGERAGEHAR